jgi:hypothetical protein
MLLMSDDEFTATASRGFSDPRRLACAVIPSLCHLSGFNLRSDFNSRSAQPAKIVDRDQDVMSELKFYFMFKVWILALKDTQGNHA